MFILINKMLVSTITDARVYGRVIGYIMTFAQFCKRTDLFLKLHNAGKEISRFFNTIIVLRI